MEELSIEKMEMKRYRALWIRTIASVVLTSWLIWFVYTIDKTDKTTAVMRFINIGIIALDIPIMWITSNVLEKIQKDKRLSAALDSEIYKEYKYKSLATGFYAALIAGLLVFLFGDMLNFSVHTAALTIIFVAGTATDIRKLILYKP